MWVLQDMECRPANSLFQLFMHNVDELKQSLLNVWRGMDYTDNAFDEWCWRPQTCVQANDEHFKYQAI